MIHTLSGCSPLHPTCNSTSFYYAGHSQLPSIQSLLDSSNVNEQLLSPLCRVTMQVCFLYYCRIQEVLNATIADIIEPDRVVLHGAKRSYSYVIYLPGLSQQVAQAAAPGASLPLFPISYIKLYRNAIRAGINTRVADSKNSRRLHAARYVFSRKSINAINGSELAGVLRHRSESSYLNYLK